MRNKYSLTLLLCFVLSQAIGQSTEKVSGYLTGQFGFTTYEKYVRQDRSIDLGIGLHAFINTKSNFKPIVDLTVDALLGGKGPYYEGNDGMEAFEGVMVNLFAGASYHPGRIIFFSLAGGPSILDKKRVVPGLKGSFGVYLSKYQRFFFRLSAIHLFNQEPLTKADAGVVVATLGVKIF